jgi:heme exporter protein D
MNWNSASEFFAMGGYATYVWGAYAVTAAVMMVEPWLAARRRRRALHEAALIASLVASVGESVVESKTNHPHRQGQRA